MRISSCLTPPHSHPAGPMRQREPRCSRGRPACHCEALHGAQTSKGCVSRWPQHYVCVCARVCMCVCGFLSLIAHLVAFSFPPQQSHMSLPFASARVCSLTAHNGCGSAGVHKDHTISIRATLPYPKDQEQEKHSKESVICEPHATFSHTSFKVFSSHKERSREVERG